MSTEDVPFSPGTPLLAADMQTRFDNLEGYLSGVPQGAIEDEGLDENHVPTLSSTALTDFLAENELDTLHAYPNLFNLANLDLVVGVGPGIAGNGWAIVQQPAEPALILAVNDVTLGMSMGDNTRSIVVHANVELIRFESDEEPDGFTYNPWVAGAVLCILWKDQNDAWHCVPHSIRHANMRTVMGTNTAGSTQSIGGFDVPLHCELRPSDTGGLDVREIAVGICWHAHAAKSNVFVDHIFARRGSIIAEPIYGGQL